jgi:hypothetical protein
LVPAHGAADLPSITSTQMIVAYAAIAQTFELTVIDAGIE